MLDYPVPSPGPPGPYGTVTWLRATVSRFAEGETHARRRALVESLLAGLDADELRAQAARTVGVDAPYVPVAVLARALGADADLVDDVRTVGTAYHPHTEATPQADAALARIIAALPAGDEELTAARVAVLVQACEATAALVRGDDLPVPVTRRVDPDGNVIEVSLEGRPFGEGPRRCPAEALARALAT
jgi:hypothetical protein